MNKNELRNLVQKSVQDVWYNRRSLNPVEEQTEALTDALWDTLEQKLSIASIGSKRNLEEDTVAVSETERGCLMCGLKYIPASDSEKGGEKGVCGGMYCVSSESLVNGKPCKEWCGDKHCWRA